MVSPAQVHAFEQQLADPRVHALVVATPVPLNQVARMSLGVRRMAHSAMEWQRKAQHRSLQFLAGGTPTMCSMDLVLRRRVSMPGSPSSYQSVQCVVVGPMCGPVTPPARLVEANPTEVHDPAIRIHHVASDPDEEFTPAAQARRRRAAKRGGKASSVMVTAPPATLSAPNQI